MSLVDLWKSSPEQLRDKRVDQIISFAGDGKLKDGSQTCIEFRSYIDLISSSLLRKYAMDCLENTFTKSGLVLQDIVNQAGRRLGFEVLDGFYQGNKKHIGHDGLWKYPDGDQLVVEVKTTDVFSIDLETIAGYRNALIKSGAISEERSSILIIVGREDTGNLEAQIRGSKHAWDIRLLSADSLFRLISVREDIEGPEVARKICDLLIPREYTRVDGIIDLVFEATAEARDELLEEETTEEAPSNDKKTKFKPVSFHEECVARIQNKLLISLQRRAKTTFISPDKGTALICAVSREHATSSGTGYWFAFHTHQHEKLGTFQNAYLAFGCGSPDTIILVPFKEFQKWVDGLNMTTNETRQYWHIQILKDEDKFILLQKQGLKRIDLTAFLI